MTPQAQRIAIAEHLPHLIHAETLNVLDLSRPMETEFLWKDTELIKDWYPVTERDWLWIMHEAEKTLTEGQKWAYFHRLAQMAGEDTKDGNCTILTARTMLGWDAASKAEAFLRTLGKWE